MLHYVLCVSFFLCVTFSTQIEGQQLDPSGDCGSLQSGYNLYYQCVLQCYKYAFSFNSISGDLCTARASISGLQQKNFSIQDVAISLKCITGYCQATVPQPVCTGMQSTQAQTPTPTSEITEMITMSTRSGNDGDEDDCEGNDNGNNDNLGSEQSGTDGDSSNINTEPPFVGASFVTFSAEDVTIGTSTTESSITISPSDESALFTTSYSDSLTESSIMSQTDESSVDASDISENILTTPPPISIPESYTSTPAPTTISSITDSSSNSDEGENCDDNYAMTTVLTATDYATNNNYNQPTMLTDDSPNIASSNYDANHTTESRNVTSTGNDVNNSTYAGYDNGQVNGNDQGSIEQYPNAQNAINNPWSRVPINPTNQYVNGQQYSNIQSVVGTQSVNSQPVNSWQPDLNQRSSTGSNLRSSLQLPPTNLQNQGNGWQNSFEYTNFGSNGQSGSRQSNPGYVASNNWYNRGSFSGINTGGIGTDLSNGSPNRGLPTSGNAYAVQNQNMNSNSAYGMTNGGMANVNNGIPFSSYNNNG